MKCGIFLTDLHTVLFPPQLLPCIGNLKLYNQYRVIFHIYQEQKEFLSSGAAQMIVQRAENRGTRVRGKACSVSGSFRLSLEIK